MLPLEASVRCLEAALLQAKNEGEHGNVDRVVALHEKFYTLVIGTPKPAEAIPTPTEPSLSSDSRTKQADKSPDIFRVTPKR